MMPRKVAYLFSVVGSVLGLFVVISNRPVESAGIPDVLAAFPNIQFIIDTAECYHTGGILMYWDPHVPQHSHALQTVYEYIVAHLHSPVQGCCLKGGYSSDFLEAFSYGMYLVPNVGRLEERIRHLSHGCREMIAITMENLHVVRKVSRSKPTTTTTTTKPPPTTTKTTTTTTTTPTTTTTKSMTTSRTANSPTGIGCPTCDPNLNCVWNNHCGDTQCCMVRSYPGYPFSTHCAEKGDCKLMKQLATTGGEIFCCEDEACIRRIVGI